MADRCCIVHRSLSLDGTRDLDMYTRTHHGVHSAVYPEPRNAVDSPLVKLPLGANVKTYYSAYRYNIYV